MSKPMLRYARLITRALGLVLFALLLVARSAGAQNLPRIEVVPQIGHSSAVISVAFSPDGTHVLSGSFGFVKLWEVASGRLVRTYDADSSGPSSVAFTPDGTRVLSGSWDTVKLWDAASGQHLRTFEGHSGPVVRSVAFSPDGTRVLSGSGDKTLRVWDAASGRLLHTFEGHFGPVTSVAFSPDGTSVLSGSDDATLKLWDAETGWLVNTFNGHSGQVSSVAFSPDGARVVSGSQDKTVRLWDAASGQLRRTFEGHSGRVWAVAFSPDGTHVLSGSFDKTLKLWDAVSGQVVHTFGGHSSSVFSAALSPNSTRVLSGNNDNTLKLWDVESGQLLRTFEGHSHWVHLVAFSADGTRVLSSSRDATLRLWDAAHGRLVRTFEGPSSKRYSAALSFDGTRVLSGGERSVELWDAASGQLLRTFEGHSGLVVSSVAFSPDGTRVLSGSYDKTSKLWDTSSGRLLHTFEGHSHEVYSVAFSPDGTRLLSGSGDNTLRLWDAETGKLVRTFNGHSGLVFSVTFSPDGARVLSGSLDKTVRLWDAKSGQLLRTFEGHSGRVRSVAFSPDGTHVLSGSQDSTLKLWDAASGQLLRTFEGQSGWITSIAFSPDSSRVLSGSRNGTVTLWDAASDTQLVTLKGGPNGQWLALTPAGFFASSGSANDLIGIVRGLDVTTIDQVHQSLFNPDLVREALAGDAGGEVAEAAKVVNLEKVLNSGPAPLVAITSPAENHPSAPDLVTVTARIEDRGKGVGRIEWRVNGITAAVATKPEGGGPAYTATKQLALDPGDNAIEVVAYNGSNLLASLPARTTVKFTGPAEKTKTKLHILAIGINAYEDKGWTPPGSDAPLLFEPLDLAVADAKAFAANMKEAAAGLYEEVHVTLALDRDATRPNIEKSVGTVASQVHPRDTFILFAAAHGYSTKVNGRFYLIPQDYQGGVDPQALATRAIGQDALQNWLANRIRAKRALILFDTCESGALIAGHARSRTDAPSSEAAVGRLHEATGRPVLTAAAMGQFAQEGEIGASGEKHGLFTWVVLDALRKGDSNGNGLIELSELVSHVQNAIPKIVSGKGGSGQALTSETDWDKQSARFGSRGEDFVVARRLP